MTNSVRLLRLVLYYSKPIYYGEAKSMGTVEPRNDEVEIASALDCLFDAYILGKGYACS